jgi:transposase
VAVEKLRQYGTKKLIRCGDPLHFSLVTLREASAKEREMKGRQRREEPLFTYIRIEELVPQDHILRRIDRVIDFSIVHEKTRDLYSHTGRPSIDPEVMIRMMTVGYLYGMTSERRLCEEVNLNLAYRWFCGLNLGDRVPDHSTFSKNRYGRFADTGLFREVFLDIVRQAQTRGLVSGKHLTVDATGVQANASLESLEEIVVPLEAEEYLRQVEEQNPVAQDQNPLPSTGKRYSNQTHQSRTDPDAKLFSKNHEKTRLAYSHNVLMDNAHRVILDVEVTEPNLHQEGQAAGAMVQRSQFTLGIEPETLGGDKAYGSGAAVRSICDAGVEPHVSHPQPKGPHMEGIFGKNDFHYDAANDQMICPAGKVLQRRVFHKRNQQMEYGARKTDCRTCPLKAQCTRALCRVVHRHQEQDVLDYAARLRKTHGYRISQRCRKKIEMLFGEAKEFMGLRKARRRRFANVLEQCLITATVQNIKRIVALVERFPSPSAVVSSCQGSLKEIGLGFMSFCSLVRSLSGVDIFWQRPFRALASDYPSF